MLGVLMPGPLLVALDKCVIVVVGGPAMFVGFLLILSEVGVDSIGGKLLDAPNSRYNRKARSAVVYFSPPGGGGL